MLPLLHDFAGARVLVVGGGSVGARRARRFAREAEVVVVSPAFADANFGGAERVRAALDPDDAGEWLDRVDPALVVAATDDGALNDAVAAAARERGVLVNRADRHGGHDPGRVTVPAALFDDPVVVAIATGGASPALSGYLRERIAEEIAGAGRVADLTGGLREELRERGVDPDARRAAIRAVVRSERVWRAAREEGDAEAIAREVVADAVAEHG